MKKISWKGAYLISMFGVLILDIIQSNVNVSFDGFFLVYSLALLILTIFVVNPDED